MSPTTKRYGSWMSLYNYRSPRLWKRLHRPDPAEGSRHLVGQGATGAWAGHDHAVAVFADATWQFHDPVPGWLAWLRDRQAFAVFDGSFWGEAELPTPARFGVNASADAQTRLAVAAAASLSTHDGSDHRLKINKASAADTASLLFQCGYAGRAELG